MTYQGGVKAYNELPTLNVQVGDTYIATEAFTYTVDDNTVQVYAGDLLIAKGDETGEGNDAVITANLAWEHVSTGYDESLQDSLKAENNAIHLLDYADNAISGVAFTTDTAKSVSISTNAEGSAINLSIEWGSF